MFTPRVRASVVVVGMVMALLLPAGAASAACHIAGFFSTDLSTSEADGSIDVTVVLQGRQPSCEGTVDFTTAEGSATAEEDFEPTSGTLEFVEGDDREEIVTIPIVSDDTAEGEEEFRVELSNPTEGISGTGGPAMVTIAADDGAGTDRGDGDDTSGETVEGQPTEMMPDEQDDDFPLVAVLVGAGALLAIAGIVLSRRSSGPE